MAGHLRSDLCAQRNRIYFLRSKFDIKTVSFSGIITLFMQYYFTQLILCEVDLALFFAAF